MERLTERHGKYVEIVGCKTLYDNKERKRAPASSAIARLAKYEDTGLTPDEIKTLIAERDALLEELHGKCYACKHNAGWHNIGKCYTCKYETATAFLREDAGKHNEDNWQWKGIGD